MNTIRKVCLSAVLAIGTLIPCESYGSVVNDSESIETVAVELQGLSICHQREWRKMTVHLDYRMSKDHPATDVNMVKGKIRSFLDHYSQEDDFWEIMNTNLVRYLSESFPEMEAIKSTLCLAPDATLKNHRKSIVRLDREAETMSEAFVYLKSNYLICQETFKALDLRITWEMLPNPDPATDYPDYLWIDSAIDAFFREHPVSVSEWKSLKPCLQEYLLGQFPSLASVDIEVTVAE